MPGGAMMDWRDQWDFEGVFTPAQAALLIEGKNPVMYSISTETSPIYRRLNRDVREALFATRCGQPVPDGTIVTIGSERMILRSEMVQWLKTNSLPSVYEFDLTKKQNQQTDPQQSAPADSIDPSDYPEELDAANMAFRAVKNGYGNANETFRNRLIAYLGEHYKHLVPEAVGRIATVANHDKTKGRKGKAKE